MTHKNSKFKIGEEEWEVIFLPKIFRKDKYIAAARVPSQKKILVSELSPEGKTIEEKELQEIFIKAVTPLYIKWAEEEEEIKKKKSPHEAES